MNFKVYGYIALRIVILGTLGTILTYIPEHLHGFFGDTPVKKDQFALIDDGYDWGIRHYWYFWTVFLLFILSIISSIVSIATFIDKHQK